MEVGISVEPRDSRRVESNKPLSCYFDHDGGFDDFVALVYLLKHQARGSMYVFSLHSATTGIPLPSFWVELLGVTVTPANSWKKVGTEVTRKILGIFRSHDRQPVAKTVPVAESTLPGKNHFPDAWRFFCCAINLMPQLNPFKSPEEARHVTEEGPEISGQELLAKTLLSSETPLILIVSGPLSNLAWVLDNVPEACLKIDKVFVMGGALDVPGNVSVEGFDGSAEWNFFWDPSAAKRVWDSDLELMLMPLDSTNSLPITKDVILRLCQEGRNSDHSSLVATIWTMVGRHMLEKDEPFFSWDLVSVVHLVHPELFTTSEVDCDIITEGASQGRLVRYKSGDGVGRGRRVTIAQAQDAERLYGTVVDELCSST